MNQKSPLITGNLDSIVLFTELTLDDFLHDSSPIFALALHDILNTPIVRIFDPIEVEECGLSEDEDSPDFPFIHDFCVSDGERIDVRGRISDQNVFLEEFSFDALAEHKIENIDWYRTMTESWYKKYLGDEQFKIWMEIAKDWILSHPEVYFPQKEPLE